MTVHWSLISLALAAVAVVDLVGCGWVLRHRGAIGRVSVAVLLGAAGTWCLAYGLELATEPGVREFWVVGEYLASTVLPPAWLIFVLRYTGHRWRITRRFLGLLAAEPLIVLGLLAAPATRGLVQYYGTETAGPLPSVRFGPAYWTHFLYVNALVLLASGRLVVTLTRISPMYRRQTRTLLAAVILPMIANALSSFSVGPFRWFDPTPVAVSASGWVIVWGAFRFRLLDLLPVARTTVFERMSDGVLVIDAYRRNRRSQSRGSVHPRRRSGCRPTGRGRAP